MTWHFTDTNVITAPSFLALPYPTRLSQRREPGKGGDAVQVEVTFSETVTHPTQELHQHVKVGNGTEGFDAILHTGATVHR